MSFPLKNLLFYVPTIIPPPKNYSKWVQLKTEEEEGKKSGLFLYLFSMLESFAKHIWSYGVPLLSAFSTNNWALVSSFSKSKLGLAPSIRLGLERQKGLNSFLCFHSKGPKTHLKVNQDRLVYWARANWACVLGPFLLLLELRNKMEAPLGREDLPLWPCPLRKSTLGIKKWVTPFFSTCFEKMRLDLFFFINALSHLFRGSTPIRVMHRAFRAHVFFLLFIHLWIYNNF